MITRDDAFALIQEHSKEPHLIPHALETEAVMRALAEKKGADADLWGITGLLHDLDFSECKDDMTRHGMRTCEMLGDQLPAEALHAIQAHNYENTGVEPETEFDYALRCGESVTGLIHTNALVRPQGMDGMKPKSLKKKMKDKAFAANVNRDEIRECEKIGIELGEFFQLCVAAITPLAAEVGLVKE